MGKPVRSNSQSKSVDAAEVARFTALASAWWDSDGEFAPLHQLNPCRLQYIRDRLVQHFGLTGSGFSPLDGLSLLDVGCGGGLLCEPLSRMGASVTGIDVGLENIEAARLHGDRMGLTIDYRHISAEALSGTDERFDVIINMEVLEHVADVSSLLGGCRKLLKDDGILLLSTLNRTPAACAKAIIGAEYVMRWLPRGTHDWNRFIRPQELADYLRVSGFEPGPPAGMMFNPLSGHWRVGRDTSVNYLIAATPV